MTEALLNSGPIDNVLEIGTGCGYQTAVIAQLAQKVFSIERIKPLLDRAKKNIKLLRLRNVELRHDDGILGWPDRAPFDAIITTAAPQQIPQELLSQLNSNGGRLIIPVGGSGIQKLQLITAQDGDFTSVTLDQVRFVPLLAGKVQG
jgi:protein-L-isoaspartate(D-aspartate) O-methyltransferase